MRGAPTARRSSTWPSRRRSTPCPSSGRTISSGCASSPPPSARRTPPTTSTSSRSAAKLRELVPTRGTPLYTTTAASIDLVKKQYKPALINAVVLLTDGKNEDPRNDDLPGTLAKLSAGSEGGASEPVRLFTIGFGKDADPSALRRLAEATSASYYDSSDPKVIDRVFTNVISNF